MVRRALSALSTSCVVQARMRSTRLPGKVLAELGGRPLLAFLLRRLARSGPDHLVVATSDAGEDDPVAELAAAEGADVVRGPEEDVLARFALALDRFPADTVVRVTGDCPLVDPALVRRAIEVRETTGADYVSNTLVRTFPDGLDVEVVDAEALQRAAVEAVDPVEREHVTPYVYRRPERFALRSFRHPVVLSEHRWTVDTPDDLALVASIVDRLGRDDFTWEEALSVVEPPKAPADGFSFLPAGSGDAGFLLALRNDPDSVRWSRSGRPVDRGEHESWFASVLDDPATRIWVAREDGRPVGQVRVDVEAGAGAVSISVDPSSRGRGVASRMLGHLVAALGADEQVHALVAEVREGNEASSRAFERVGFTPSGREGGFLLMRRERRPDRSRGRT